MKRILILLLGVAVAIVSATAQTRIKASEIIKKINAGQAVEYTNVEIEGDLDLTDLDNRRPEHSSSNWILGMSFDNNVYESSIEAPVRFTNCKFLGDVLGYYHIERTNKTYIAHFEKDAIFKNCLFQGASEFKYSEFEQEADFSGSTFNRVANFKYAEFANGPSFATCKFEDDADFKYTEFPPETTFNKAVFYELANFKYSKFRSPIDIKSASFKGNEDFKYTRIDGRSFTSYLLND
jgi:uncharacterized protein YjbI with pentapeptide repeats